MTRIICMNCQQQYGEKPGNDFDSHGICPACVPIVRKQYGLPAAEEVLDKTDQKPVPLWHTVAALIVWVLVWSGLAFLILSRVGCNLAPA